MKIKRTILLLATCLVFLLIGCDDFSGGVQQKTLSGIVNITSATGASNATGVELTAVYTGEENVSFQWKKDGVSIGSSGTANPNKFGPDLGGDYHVTVSAAGYKSVDSQVVVVTVLNVPIPVITISGHPQNTLVVQDAITQTLNVTASVTLSAELSYQWYSNTANNNTSGTSLGLGAAAAVFNIPADLTALNSPYYYYCVVSAPNAASVRSNVAIVYVDNEDEDPGIEVPLNWDTGSGSGTLINNPRVLTLDAPVAGNYPQSYYRYPYAIGRGGTFENVDYIQTIEWFPAINKTFIPNTKYVAVITLEPKQSNRTLRGTIQGSVQGLADIQGVERISAEAYGTNAIKIYITFNRTAAVRAEPQIVFEDEFTGTSLDWSKWDTPTNVNRQERSLWDHNMVSVSDGNLRIRVERDDSLGSNWIRTGCVQSRVARPRDGQNYGPYWGPTLFEQSYGYYEARVKFPVVRGTWGAFWLMTNTMDDNNPNHGILGTEIDIVESIGNETGAYNSALHWGGYNANHRKAGWEAPVGNRINIYDGNYHVFAVDWGPKEYVFYVNDVEFARTDGGASANNAGINQNPNYIMFSIEGADWAGTLTSGFTEAEMLVDWVRIWNQPKQ